MLVTSITLPSIYTVNSTVLEAAVGVTTRDECLMFICHATIHFHTMAMLFIIVVPHINISEV